MRPNARRVLSRIHLVASWFAFQAITWGQQVSAQPRIVQPVDETQLTSLKGNTHPLARPQFDQGAAPPNLPMERMLLVLKRSPEQESALRSLLDNQQDKASPYYHKWLTPEQFGKQFGPAEQDVQVVTSWLQVHGFQVAQVAKGRAVIEFSGTAAQVQEAFHTAIHKYTVDGEEHWANATDPQIPAALTPVVAGVHTLHNFLKKPAIKISGPPLVATLNKGKPQLTFPDGKHGLTLTDYATIYGATQLSAQGIQGQGQSIAVVARSNLFHQGQDVGDFHSFFPPCCGNLNILLNGPDPGDLGGGEEFEATLDATWSAALAPFANIDFVVSATTNTTDGVDLSELYIVENNLAPVMTESFSGCEALRATAELDNIEALAEQAAAQGITYMVSSGDAGAAGCDDPNNSSAEFGTSVNALASSPFTVAVGGTLFNENGHDTNYWSATDNASGGSALGYIPEDVWNESGPGLGLWSSGGGVSSFFAKPSWQSAVAGIPAGNFRDLPDVSLTAALHDAYLICFEGSCQPNSQGQIALYLVSGTSASAPSFASIMALVNQKTGSRQGQANYVLYQLAAQETFMLCNASNTVAPPASTCVFNDVTIGNNSVPGLTGFNSGVGYDLATGLGSVNVTNLVNAWSAMTFNATTTTLLLNNSTGPITLPHGTSIPVNITVQGNSGTPTGDVSLSAAAVLNPTSVQTVPLCTSPNICTLSPIGTNIASLSAATSLLPGGAWLVTAHYPGDGKFASSDSNPGILVTVSSEQSTTTASIFARDVNGVPVTQGPASSVVYLSANVVGMSKVGIPTGSISFMDKGASVAGNPYVLNSQGSTGTPNGLAACSLAVGSHPIVANYSGDQSFNSSSSPLVSFTITAADFCMPTSLASITVTAGIPGTTALAVAASPGLSGAINFACAGLPAESQCVFSPLSITGGGVTTISVGTTAPHPALKISSASGGLGWWMSGLGASAAGIFLFGAPSRRRWSTLLSLLAIGFLITIPACGGGSSTPPPPPDPGTPKGNYNIIVTATSGSLSHATSFILTVQ